MPRVVQQPPQIVGEIRRGRLAILDALRQGFQADTIEFGRNGRQELAQRLRFVLLDLPHQLASIEGPERHPAAEQLVEHHAETINVGASVDAMRAPRGLLRCHVLIGARNQAELAADRLVEAEAEVDQHRAAALGHDHVFRLHVAVDRGARVRVRERVGDLRHDPHGLAPFRTHGSHPLMQVGPLEIVRDDVDEAILHADIVHGDDSGMTQLREPSCLGMKALGIGVGGACPGVEDLDRDGTAELLVLGEEDLAVSPRTEGTFDDISAERPRDRPVAGGLRQWRI